MTNINFFSITKQKSSFTVKALSSPGGLISFRTRQRGGLIEKGLGLIRVGGLAEWQNGRIGKFD